MKSLRDELLNKYNMDINLTSCYALIRSYACGADDPVIFTHYTHEQNFPPYTSAVNDQDYCSAYIFLSGNFSFICENQFYSPSYGDVIFFREHEKFTTCFHSIGHIDYYELVFRKEFFEKAPCAEIFANPFYNRELAEKNLLVLDNHNRSIMLEKLQEIEHIISAGYKHSELLAYSYITQIMDILSYSFSYHEFPLPISKIPQKLNDAVVYIHENFQTIESINEISSFCGISNAYLGKMFKTYLSCTPIEYVATRRISYAKYLLASGESLTDACFKSGFNNYNYFISKFKKITGVTPLKAKKGHATRA